MFEDGIRALCDVSTIIRKFDSALSPDTLLELITGRDAGKPISLVLALTCRHLDQDLPYLPTQYSDLPLPTAENLLFHSPGSVETPNLDILQSDQPFKEKAAAMWKGLFPPRNIITGIYSVPYNSKLIYLLHIRRLTRLFFRTINLGLKRISGKLEVGKPDRNSTEVTRLRAWLDPIK